MRDARDGRRTDEEDSERILIGGIFCRLQTYEPDPTKDNATVMLHS